jgi:hypothetical protein
MKGVKDAERKVSERQGALDKLISEQQKLTQALEPLEKSKQELVSRGGDDIRAQKKYREVFEKISDLNFEKEKLEASVLRAREELDGASEVLRAARAEQMARLEAFLQDRERTRIEDLEKSLSGELEKFTSAYFQVCLIGGDLLLRASRFTEGEGTTVVSEAVAKFFEDLPHGVEQAFKNGFAVCPKAWPWEIVVRPMLRTNGSLDFKGALKISIEERVAKSRKEFFQKEEV